MVRRALPYLAVLFVSSAFLAPASAQEDSDNAPPHISRIDGQVTIERSGQPDAASLNMPVIAGDRLRTAGERVDGSRQAASARPLRDLIAAPQSPASAAISRDSLSSSGVITRLVRSCALGRVIQYPSDVSDCIERPGRTGSRLRGDDSGARGDVSTSLRATRAAQSTAG